MIKQKNKQAGGTLLGMVIGLVIGLGIAVAVAMIITKSPLPFMNKTGRPEKAPELTSAQTSDPNQPLYGSKQAARDAAKDFVKEPTPQPTVEENKIVPLDKTAAGDTQQATKPAQSKSKDVKVTSIKPDDASKSNATDDKWVYYLQAGAFRDQADAESARAKLALQGFEANVSEKTSDNGSLYRVRLGPYNQLDAMNLVRSKLSDSGMDAAVVRIAK
jgi:cell division protein FtsN